MDNQKTADKNNGQKINVNSSEICEICKSNFLIVDINKIKYKKIKEFLKNSNLTENELTKLVRKCNCNSVVHKYCLLMTIILKFELKCQECGANYDLSITKIINKNKKTYLIIQYAILYFIHLIFYGFSITLFILYFLPDKKLEINNKEKELFKNVQYFIAIIIICINTFFLVNTIKSNYNSYKHNIYNFGIDFQKCNNTSDKYYEILYDFFRNIYNKQIRYLFYERQTLLYESKGYGLINKDYLSFIKSNNIEFENEYDIDTELNKEQNYKQRKSNGILEKSKTEYLYNIWNKENQNEKKKSNGIKSGLIPVIKKNKNLGGCLNFSNLDEKVQISKNEGTPLKKESNQNFNDSSDIFRNSNNLNNIEEEIKANENSQNQIITLNKKDSKKELIINEETKKTKKNDYQVMILKENNSQSENFESVINKQKLLSEIKESPIRENMKKGTITDYIESYPIQNVNHNNSTTNLKNLGKNKVGDVKLDSSASLALNNNNIDSQNIGTETGGGLKNYIIKKRNYRKSCSAAMITTNNLMESTNNNLYTFKQNEKSKLPLNVTESSNFSNNQNNPFIEGVSIDEEEEEKEKEIEKVKECLIPNNNNGK